MGMRLRLAAATVVVALVGVGACSSAGEDDGVRSEASLPTSAGADAGSSNDDFAKSSGSSVANATTAAAVESGGGGGGSQDGAATVADTEATAAAPLPPGIGAPRVIKTAIIDLEVAEGRFDVAFSKVPSIAAALGGFVASSTSSQAGGADDDRQAAGSLVLRVPAEHFESARTELLKLGELRSQQVKGDDVSAQLTDLDARLRNLRSQEEALRLLMTRTKTIGETIEVQRQLGGVREQIEQLAAQQARLSDAVAMSTLTVNLAEPGAAMKAEADPSPLGEAVRQAVRGAQNVLAGTIVAIGYVVPLALLLAAAWLVSRPIRGRLSSS